jgi:uncharacterized protein (DUF934 family)
MRFIDPAHDDWQPLRECDAAIPRARALLSPAQWELLRQTWPAALPVGVRLANDGDVDALADDLHRLALVALAFPRWTDGRAYSQARLLRTRLRFGGELRATGEVLVDMLPLLQRTGFDAVVLRADQSLDSAQRALRFFAGHYQGDAVDPRPVFRRTVLQGGDLVGH